MLRRLWANEKGFTLMEIVIVIVILGILALLAIPRLLGFTEQAEIANDKEYAAVVGKAAELYWASHDKDIELGTVVGVDDSEYLVLLAADLFTAKAQMLQYYDPDASVSVSISDGTDEVDVDGTDTAVDKGVAIVTISGEVDDTDPGKDIIYTSQFGYTELP